MTALSVAEVLDTCTGCEVVLGCLPGGQDFSIIRGDGVLKDIIANGQREIKIGYVPVADLADAKRIAGILNAN